MIDQASRNSIGTAKGVLFGIGEDQPQLLSAIEGDWSKAMAIHSQEAREEAAWALVKRYSLIQARALHDEAWHLAVLLSSHAAGDSRRIGYDQNTARQRLSGRLQYAESYGDHDVTKGIIEDAREIIAICMQALEEPAASQAKQIWLSERSAGKNIHHTSAGNKDNKDKQRKRDRKREQDRELTRKQKEAGSRVPK